MTAQPATAPTDIARLIELARYTRAVLQAYLAGESEDLTSLIAWIDRELEAMNEGRPASPHVAIRP
jgi:hypothetical protein